MAYTLNEYFKAVFSNPSAPRVIVYPNNTVAAQLFNHLKNGENVISVSDCLSGNETQLPMPNVIMRTIDGKIQKVNGRALIVGLDAYVALLDAGAVITFMSELRKRLDLNVLNADYLLSVHHNMNFMPRYEESRAVIIISENEEILEPLNIQAYSDKWIKSDGITNYKQLLEKMGPYESSGNYTLVLTGLTEKQAGISNAVSFVFELHDVAVKHYGLDSDLDDTALEQLLLKSVESEKSPEVYLETLFGVDNINTHCALKRLLEIPADVLWSAHIWILRRRLPSNSYIARVISENVTYDNLLWKYVVGSAIEVLSDINAKKYAAERAETLKTITTNYESLIVEFIEQTKESRNALQFLNCGTETERVEIIRRASKEDLSYGLPQEYSELFPPLADYLSTDFDFGNITVTDYFNEYRKLKISGKITDSFVDTAYNTVVPQSYPARDSIIAEFQADPDTALLIVDAMGIEYMPLLLAVAKRRKMSIELQTVAYVKLPSETQFNPISWDKSRKLPEIKGIDNTVHDGSERHEISSPEQNLAKTLLLFETKIMTCIANGLKKFERVVVTADHGASRLAVIAHNEGKDKNLPWNGKPDNWRYSHALQGVARPPEFEQSYFPETEETYWIVRGYSRLQKKGGKLYELHGGATLEERLVPIVVFTRNAAEEISEQPGKKSAPDLIDEFEGLI